MSGSRASRQEEGQGRTLAAFITEDWLPVAATSWSERGWRERASAIARTLAEQLGDVPLDQLDRKRCAQWWATLRARVTRGRWAPETANKHLAMLRQIARAAMEWDMLRSDPTLGLKRVRVDPTTLPTEYFRTDEERERLLAAANPELRRCILIATYTGARRGSLVRLTAGDVDLAGQTIAFPTKTGQRHRVALHPRLAEALAPCLGAGVPPTTRLVSYTDPHAITTAFRRLVRRVGLGRRFRFHDLRHDVGTRILRQTGNLRLAQRVLGHARVSQTERYTRVLDQDVSEAIAVL